MRSVSIGLAFFSLAVLFSCTSGRNYSLPDIGYDFSKPDYRYFLDDTLREISGAVVLDSMTFACVQDEVGTVFVCDHDDGHIVSAYQFAVEGDYEGIARVNEDLFVLRSDGELFRVAGFMSEKPEISQYTTGIPSDNNEGLCYDPGHGRLLIACKGKIGKGPEFRDLRVIYAFDLTRFQLSPDPVFEFDLGLIRKFVTDNGVQLEMKENKKTGKKEPFIRFRPSAIGIHSVTGDLYVLSAADRALFIFDQAGILLYVIPLDPGLFNKPEGISFFPSGEVIISNEGQDGLPTLLRFQYRP